MRALIQSSGTVLHFEGRMYSSLMPTANCREMTTNSHTSAGERQSRLQNNQGALRVVGSSIRSYFSQEIQKAELGFLLNIFPQLNKSFMLKIPT